MDDFGLDSLRPFINSRIMVESKRKRQRGILLQVTEKALLLQLPNEKKWLSLESLDAIFFPIKRNNPHLE